MSVYNPRWRLSSEVPLSRPPPPGPSSGLRLVLKVGATPEHEPGTPPPAVAPLRFSRAVITEAETQRKEKKHKKKKKKDKERDREHRERHRLKKVRPCDVVQACCPVPNVLRFHVSGKNGSIWSFISFSGLFGHEIAMCFLNDLSK